MANEILTHKHCTITVGTTTVKFEEPGNFTFSVPPEVRLLRDRGANTSTTVDIDEQDIPFSFSCLLSDDQEVSDFFSGLSGGTEHVEFAIAYTSATITHKFWYVTATISVEERAEGNLLSIDGVAQGYSNGTDSYGKAS